MKLAEALLLRSDLQKKLASLRERINRNTLSQEGEAPAEDPNLLLRQAREVVGQLQKQILAVNEANLRGRTAGKRSITAALAERDGLMLMHSIVQGAAASAAKPPERYGVKEIRWVKAVDVPALQKEADDLAKQLRQVNAEVQAANWILEINDV